MPMFDTIILKSRGSTICRTRSSTLATYALVDSMRLPVGTFKLIVNCPASVRGKKATPASGYRPRLRRNRTASAATVSPGRPSARRTRRSYASSSLLNRVLNRAGNHRRDAVHALQEPRTEQGNDGHRHEVRGEQRDHDRQGQGREQKLADAV